MKLYIFLTLFHIIESLNRISKCISCKYFLRDNYYSTIGKCSLYRVYSKTGVEYENAASVRMNNLKCGENFTKFMYNNLLD